MGIVDPGEELVSPAAHRGDIWEELGGLYGESGYPRAQRKQKSERRWAAYRY